MNLYPASKLSLLSVGLVLCLVVFLAHIASVYAGDLEEKYKDIVELMSKDEWPEYSSAFRKNANELIFTAADMIAHSSECDKVTVVGLDKDLSQLKKGIVFSGWCANGKVFTVSEQEIKSASHLKSETGKTSSITDDQARDFCLRSLIKEYLPVKSLYPGLNPNVERGKNGNIAVTFQFFKEKENYLSGGLEIRCFITPSDGNSLEIRDISSKGLQAEPKVISLPLYK